MDLLWDLLLTNQYIPSTTIYVFEMTNQIVSTMVITIIRVNIANINRINGFPFFILSYIMIGRNQRLINDAPLLHILGMLFIQTHMQLHQKKYTQHTYIPKKKKKKTNTQKKVVSDIDTRNRTYMHGRHSDVDLHNELHWHAANKIHNKNIHIT